MLERRLRTSEGRRLRNASVRRTGAAATSSLDDSVPLRRLLSRYERVLAERNRLYSAGLTARSELNVFWTGSIGFGQERNA